MGTLPGFAMNASNYKQVEKDFAEWLYRNERADVLSCPALKEWSKLGESEADFRARLTLEAREARDAAVSELRDSAAKKMRWPIVVHRLAARKYFASGCELRAAPIAVRSVNKKTSGPEALISSSTVW